MSATQQKTAGARHATAVVFTALAEVGVLVTTFYLPMGARRAFFISAGVVGLIAAAVMTRVLRASLLTVPAGLVAGYLLFSIVFYIFIYDPR